MNITQYGTVDLDPNQVPASNLQSHGDRNDFERKLTAAELDNSRHDAPRVDSRNPDVEKKESEANPEAPQNETAQQDAADQPAKETAGGNELPADADGRAASAHSLPGESSERRNPSGIGSGASSAAASTHPGESGLSASTGSQDGQTAADKNQGQLIGQGALLATQQPQVAAVRTGPDGAVTAARGANAASANKHVRVHAPQASFRTASPQMVQAAEQARDSVFKQIAFNLGEKGGEMLMRLDPPQLGMLDLHMVVEKGSVLRLSIGAERPEVLAMLDKHVAELRDVLESQGFDMSQTELHTSLMNENGHAAFDAKRRQLFSNGQENADSENPTPAPRTWISAEGLDFFV